MERFYSKKSEELIFSLLRHGEITDRRQDMSPEEEYLQVCGRRMGEEVYVPAHRHLVAERKINLTQEAWVILEGSVKARFYDIDDAFLCERIINAGDVVVLYRGGHSLQVMSENTVFYEFKNGPYYGVDKDKERIDD